MHELLGRVSVGELIKRLSQLPKDAMILPVRVEDDQCGEQSNIRIQTVTAKGEVPRLIIGWHDPNEVAIQEFVDPIDVEDE